MTLEGAVHYPHLPEQGISHTLPTVGLLQQDLYTHEHLFRLFI
jgi:hypothetical protein